MCWSKSGAPPDATSKFAHRVDSRAGEQVRSARVSECIGIGDNRFAVPTRIIRGKVGER